MNLILKLAELLLRFICLEKKKLLRQLRLEIIILMDLERFLLIPLSFVLVDMNFGLYLELDLLII